MIVSQPMAFIDVETTGTDCKTHEILELGLVLTKFKDGTLTVIDTLDIKVQPSSIETADPVALRVNGYNEADWLFAVSLQEAMRLFAEKTEGAIFVAHNMMFDYGFIEQAFKKTGLENKMHFHKFDTLSMAFATLHNEDINRLSLGALCEHFGIENKKAHSAFADAYATHEVFKKLLHIK